MKYHILVLEPPTKTAVDNQCGLEHRLSSYTPMSSVAEPSIGSLIGSLEAE